MTRLRQVLAGSLVLMGLGGGAAAAQEADSTMPYAAMLQQYDAGRTEPAFVRALARRARAEGDTARAATLSAAYLARLPEVYTPEHIGFVRQFTQRSTDPGFALFHEQGAKVDAAMGEPGYAEAVVDDIITREVVNPVVSPGGEPSPTEPDWAALRATITQQYGARYAGPTVGRAQVFWYWRKQRWPEFRRALLAFVEQYGLERSRVHVNNAAWQFFKFSADSVELAAAASWMARVVQQEPDDEASLDTYANLLYKLGRVAEGVAWQEKAFTVATAKQVPNLKVYQETLTKMQQGEPTWPTE